MKITRQTPFDKVKQYIAESPSTRDPRYFVYSIRRQGVKHLKKLLRFNELYDAEFFADNEQHFKIGHQKLAELIYDWYEPSSVCDMGCGNGFILFVLAQKGVQICGVERAREALQFIDPGIVDRIKIRDITQPQDVGEYDLVISTEVAEHIPKKYSSLFVQNIVRAARRNILFTASHPGQWGEGHINCQPRGFWIDLFDRHGWHYDSPATNSFIQKAKSTPEITGYISWIVENFMLFRDRK